MTGSLKLKISDKHQKICRRKSKHVNITTCVSLTKIADLHFAVLVKLTQADYNLVPEGIPDRVAYLQGKIIDLQEEKQSQIRYTNEREQVRDGLIREYKYTKALSDTQYKAFVEISTRHDARAKLPDHDERHFRISRDDRTVILERMAEKYPNVVERCKENFAYKDQLDKGKNVMAKRMPTNDMGMER